jgi:hypothetical protein
MHQQGSISDPVEDVTRHIFDNSKRTGVFEFSSTVPLGIFTELACNMVSEKISISFPELSKGFPRKEAQTVSNAQFSEVMVDAGSK